VSDRLFWICLQKEKKGKEDMKKIVCLFMTALLLFGCCSNAFADTAAIHKITIGNEKKGHVYQAYQIFKGDLDQSKTI
jgi:hypothetical protein